MWTCIFCFHMKIKFQHVKTVMTILPCETANTFFFIPSFAILSNRCNSPTGSGGEGRVMRNMTRPTTILNTHALQPEASHTNVSEETLFN